MIRVAFILMLFALLATPSKGQVVEGKVKSYVDSLKANGIETFLIYTYYSSGKLPAINPCDSEESQYLFWGSAKQAFVKKFDKCSSHEPVKLTDVNPLDFYALNRLRIEKEKIKAPTKLVKAKGSRTEEVSFVSHSYFHKFRFLNQDILTEKVISSYALNLETFDDGKPNIYYKRNQSTKTKELVDMTTKAVKKIEAVTNNRIK
ncbi:hypothetical protein I2I11_21155 [Pontibacter sp. 172403-2]|uniref:hypothetical protein n=1 Tax=Pontibacter rufus TaxID=2791028 RepID=UPI0018AFFDC1|nr:hypothetical protein [Pontibacter sp. 172403-2]MBF9255821.1 hypothetical protein [Pontibacter sp. 172403-2]